VPIAFTGLSPAEGLRVGIVLRQTETLAVRGLPGRLPRAIEADLSGLAEVGDRLLARDLPIPEDVELVSDPETVIATVVRPAVEVPEAPPEAAGEQKREETERETGP
jgi:large subunit ribosomal protein L25